MKILFIILILYTFTFFNVSGVYLHKYPARIIRVRRQQPTTSTTAPVTDAPTQTPSTAAPTPAPPTQPPSSTAAPITTSPTTIPPPSTSNSPTIAPTVPTTSAPRRIRFRFRIRFRRNRNPFPGFPRRNDFLPLVSFPFNNPFFNRRNPRANLYRSNNFQSDSNQKLNSFDYIKDLLESEEDKVENYPTGSNENPLLDFFLLEPGLFRSEKKQNCNDECKRKMI